MNKLKLQLKNWIEAITGYEIVRYGPGTFALINNKRLSDIWFSRHAQLRALFQKHNIDLVVDVGANEGQFAREIRTFYHGDIVSFEPAKVVFSKLAKAAAADSKWHVHQLALGNYVGTQTLHVSEQTIFSSLLKATDYSFHRFGPSALGNQEETVQVDRLDNTLDKLFPSIEDKRIFLKMDTQGYDAEVFKGVGGRLNLVTVLQSEVSVIPIYDGMPHWTDSISLYEEAGFGVVGLFPVTRDAGQVVEFDCLMARAC